MTSDGDRPSDASPGDTAAATTEGGESLTPALDEAELLATMPYGDARYVVGDLIGMGGMGDVLRATDAQIGRDVAIKRLRSATKTSLRRFLREARIQGRLEHPAIVPVHEVAVDATGRPYFVMKRLTGTTLAELLSAKERGEAPSPTEPHTLSRLLRAFSDVCLAVEFAHTRGVIHRDLKPQNIMLGDFGEVYVLDWGVARVIGDDRIDSVEVAGRPSGPIGTTEVGAVLGTVGYMPPEQLRGLPVDRRADVYALGCILFEILTGQPLHPRGEMTAVLEDYDARASVRAPDREVPPELEELVVHATEREPEARPATARELSDRVQRYLDGDRDVALRRKTAREQLAIARRALSDDDDDDIMTTSMLSRKPPTEDQRRAAMQAAGRALALDPQSREAQALVGRIMLEPPDVLPREVQADLEAIDHQNLRQQARFVTLAYLAYLAFVPLMYWVGATEPWFLGGVAAIAVMNALLSHRLARRERGLTRSVAVTGLVSNVILIGLLSCMFTPFLVAPGLAAATMLAMAIQVRYGPVVVIASALTIGVMAGSIAQAFGAWPGMVTATESGALVLHSPAGALDVSRVHISHGVYAFALVLVAGLLVRMLVRSQRAARQAALVQAWHLGQLVPASRASTQR